LRGCARVRACTAASRKPPAASSQAEAISQHMPLYAIISFDQQLRDHTGKKPKYQLVLQKVMRAAPRFFWCALAWHL
jgi:hypothetical protein